MTLRLRRYAALAICVTALLSGCATQPSRSVDVDRLLNAIALDDVGEVRDIVQAAAAGVNASVPAPGYPDGTPLLTLAARDGAVEVLRYLVASGANVDARTPVGETAVMLAAYFPNGQADAAVLDRHERAVELLVNAGANVENDAYNYTALSYAAYQDRRNIIRYLLKRGARVDGTVQAGVTYVNTPLMMAAIQGHYDVAISLLRAGADARIREYRGRTAAQFAAKYKHERLADILLCAQGLARTAKFEGSCLNQSTAQR
ncbi:MAG TPA: ankyrin repeat domain-containing protein [Burkholderiales bacterium]